jgi:DNA recombination protein RmuC
MNSLSVVGIPEGLLIVLLALTVATTVLQFFLWKRQSGFAAPPPDLAPLETQVELLRRSVEQTERGIRDEFSRLRQELAGQGQALENDVTGSLKALNDSLLQQIGVLGHGNDQRFDQLRQGVEQRLNSFSTETNQKIELLRRSSAEAAGSWHAGLSQGLDQLQSAMNLASQQSREEMSTSLTRVSESVVKSLMDMTADQKLQLGEIRTTVDTRLVSMSSDNEKRLEQMRQTVDEKLQGTLEARLGQSFQLVSERLEQVHKGLGEMQTLASGVGDLKRVLTNVKTRGTWGEVQLEALLEQILAPEQYAKNVSTTGTQERVEFAIKLPGREIGRTCWLPVDAKFPVEDYQRLVEASERGDSNAVEEATRKLEATLRLCARTICEKYLMPPATTDFGILFLATEGLYAEALRRTGLAESLQREYRVILTGPNTFAAILNSLQMGFRTLTIQQRSSEVWETLGAVKTEFSKYSMVLAKVKKKLEEASHTVDQAEVRTRVLQRHLRDVETPASESEGEVDSLLDLAAVDGDKELALADTHG